jgi:hypothetical protein
VHGFVWGKQDGLARPHACDRAIWCGDHDAEILRLSTTFPGSLDGQPLQMQKKIQELFSPLLAALQQRDTEAQRLQTAAEKKAEIAKTEKEMDTMSKDPRCQRCRCLGGPAHGAKTLTPTKACFVKWK